MTLRDDIPSESAPPAGNCHETLFNVRCSSTPSTWSQQAENWFIAKSLFWHFESTSKINFEIFTSNGSEISSKINRELLHNPKTKYFGGVSEEKRINYILNYTLLKSRVQVEKNLGATRQKSGIWVNKTFSSSKWEVKLKNSRLWKICRHGQSYLGIPKRLWLWNCFPIFRKSDEIRFIGFGQSCIS